jgi:uncharacterized protein YeaO (DUF488 family)
VPEDGCRVLVDRLWLRGLKREAVRIALWLKEAPLSAELRRWFAHDPARQETFVARYREDLSAQKPLLMDLADRARKSRLTLLCAAKD